MKGRVSQGGNERTDRDRRCNRVVGRLKSQETILSYEQKRVRGGGGRRSISEVEPLKIGPKIRRAQNDKKIGVQIERVITRRTVRRDE